jgi:hypothetical protein
LTSDRKIRANRANARASTGPQSRQGRARTARNALRHGLSLPVCSDPALSEEVEALARKIAGTDVNGQIQELARRIAEAQVDLLRVRYARHQVLSGALSDQHYDFPSKRHDENQTPAQDFAGQGVGHVNVRYVNRSPNEESTSMPARPQKFALILSQEAKQLLAMDRYEQRALLRRNTAIRELDERQRQQN